MATRMTLYGLGEVSDGDLFVLDAEALQRGVIKKSPHAKIFADVCKQEGITEFSEIRIRWTGLHYQWEFGLIRPVEGTVFWEGDADNKASVLHNFLKRKSDFTRKPKQKIQRSW
jgi:hypothetical protein